MLTFHLRVLQPIPGCLVMLQDPSLFDSESGHSGNFGESLSTATLNFILSTTKECEALLANLECQYQAILCTVISKGGV